MVGPRQTAPADGCKPVSERLGSGQRRYRGHWSGSLHFDLPATDRTLVAVVDPLKIRSLPAPPTLRAQDRLASRHSHPFGNQCHQATDRSAGRFEWRLASRCGNRPCGQVATTHVLCSVELASINIGFSQLPRVSERSESMGRKLGSCVTQQRAVHYVPRCELSGIRSSSGLGESVRTLRCTTTQRALDRDCSVYSLPPPGTNSSNPA